MSVTRTGFLILVSLIAFGGGAAQAQTVTFDTSSSPFVAGRSNQGNYSDNSSNPRPSPTSPNNYVVGAITDDQYRDFFSFDLSSLSLAGKQVAAATLTLTQFSFVSATGRTSQQLGLFDVSTSASTLNTTNGQNAAIFSDLGSGNSYGTFTVSNTGTTTSTVTFTLNAAALSDITKARGGFFSVGGALTTALADATAGNNEELFSLSGTPNVARLSVTLAAAPEPSSLLVTGLGAVGTMLLARRARRRAS